MEYLNSEKKIVRYYYYMKFKLKKINIMLHTVVHDFQFYNKTLTRRKQNQIRDTLRVEDVFNQSSSLEKDAYNDILTIYKESCNLNSQAECGCACHVTNRAPVFHNSNCISICETSNLSFKNYLLNYEYHSANRVMESPLLEKIYETRENLNLSGDTMCTETNKFNIHYRLSSIFNQVKDAISPKFEKLIRHTKEEDNLKDMEAGDFESIKVLHSPHVRINMMGCDTDDFINSYDMMENEYKNASIIEAPVLNDNFFDKHEGYVLDVISM
ncbi:uncharacterized protein HGUI_03574 [Hanseniaspora guilliermondii]|uniref:Uncharacterized protein n=1 Tax=Hanseniaspora guilliermondii TaxID=56406 RepID=A0A1L0CQU2_9ASCO|nr:uncharacterized protein HGUI_03574 [Hanseniaspora guilliermondii]